MRKAVAYSRRIYAVILLLIFWARFFLLPDSFASDWRRNFRDIAEKCEDQKVDTGVWCFAPLLFLNHRHSQPAAERLLAICSPLRLRAGIQGWGSWLWDWSKGEFPRIAYGSWLAVILVCWSWQFRPATLGGCNFWVSRGANPVRPDFITPVVIDPLSTSLSR